jgi:hypothetical protein
MSTRKDRDVMKRSVLADEQSSILSSLFVASLLVAAALLLTASTSLAQNGLQLSTTHTTNPAPGSLVFQVSDDTNGKGSLFSDVDWSTWRIWMANQSGAYDITSTMLSLVGPVASLALNKDATQMTLGLPFGLPGLHFGMEACTLGPNSYCANSYRKIRDATCYPDPKCTSHSIPYPMGSNANGVADWDVTGIPLTSQSPVMLTELAAVGNIYLPQHINWGGQTPYVQIWSGTSTTTAYEEFDKDPMHGNFAKDVKPTFTAVPFNQDFYVTYKLPQHIYLPAGDYFIAIIHHQGQVSTPQSWGFHSTTVSLPSDYNTWHLTTRKPTVKWSTLQNPGVAAVDVFAY